MRASSCASVRAPGDGADGGRARGGARVRLAAGVALLASWSTLSTAGTVLATPGGAGDRPVVAWLRDGRIDARVLRATDVGASPAALPARVPLGSLWKLFVFAYLAEQRAGEAPYACSASRVERSAEDAYCCAPGENIGRDQALARSCAAYFDPQRLAIGAPEWRRHWQALGAPSWLADLGQLDPATEAPPAELLAALRSLPPVAMREARRALLDTAFAGYGRDARSALGTGVRYKTWSWHRRESPDVSYGGAAGWLPDATPFWFGARGSSRSALAAWGPAIAAALPAPRWSATGLDGERCVDVEFFARYPLRRVEREDRRGGDVVSGRLQGRYRLEFENGARLRIVGGGHLRVGHDDRPSITGRLALNDYVARVVDREGGASPEHAARALAVAARTYLVQNATFERGCWRIEDSTRTQRVSPNPPTHRALAAAWFTDDVVLQNVAVRHHRDAAGSDRLAWRDAVLRAQNGEHFERILAAAYPRATLATLTGSEECRRLEPAEAWLARASARWERSLRAETGYETLASPLQVCALGEGRPYADAARSRLYVRGWRTLDERVTLAHEYLHLAFRHHPRGSDEDYVERLARRLVEGPT